MEESGDCRRRGGDARVLLAVFLAAFSAAVAATAVTGRFSDPERWEYSEVAANLLGGRGAFYEYLGTKYYFYGPAVYPVVLAVVLWVTNHSEAAALVLQASLFAVTCLVIYLVARSFFGKVEAALAAVLAASHPGGLVYAGKLHSQTLDVFLIVLSFLFLAHVTASSGPVRAAGTGVVAGLAALSRGSVVTFFSLWAAWFLWKERRHLFGALRVVLTLAVGGVFVIAPVLVRGYLMYGEVIPLRTDTGVNLWYGNHLGASGTSYTRSPSSVDVISQLAPTLAARIAGRNEIDQNRVFMAAALEFAANDPAAAFLLFLKKIYYFWWFSPHTGLRYPTKWAIAYTIYYSVILFFGVVGLLLSLRSTRRSVRTGATLFLLIAASISATQALFYVEGRHRWAIEPLLLVFTAAGCLYFLRLFNRSRLAVTRLTFESRSATVESKR